MILFLENLILVILKKKEGKLYNSKPFLQEFKENKIKNNYHAAFCWWVSQKQLLLPTVEMFIYFIQGNKTASQMEVQ